MRVLPLLLLLALPAAQAQLLQDPAGDTTANHFGLSSTPVQGWDRVDLLGLAVEERPDALRVAVQAAKLEESTSHDAGMYLVRMRHGEQWYTVQFLQADNGSPFGYLRQSSADSPWGSGLKTLDAAIDSATGTIWADVPRHLLVDETGAPPGRGRALDNLFVESYAQATYMNLQTAAASGSPANVGDRMPDDGGASWPFQFGGGVENGPIRLDVEPPFRASNGEATTFVMQVTVTNTDDRPHAYQITTPGLPANWQAGAAGDRLELQAGMSAEFPFFLTVPFAHEHGSVVSFELHVHAEDDPEVFATEEVGVHYHTIPQPAGHHPKLHFHSSVWSGAAGAVNPPLGGTNGVLYLNTMEEDAGDQMQPIRGFSWVVSTEQHYSWAACLQPGLAMGLDFDVARTGTLDLALKTTEPVDGTLRGRLAWVAPGQSTSSWCTPYAFGQRDQVDLATIGETTVSLGAGSEGRVTATLTPTEAADRVEWQDGADLVLFLEIVRPGPALGGAAGVDLMPGSWLELPLNEYHDALPAILTQGDGTQAPDPENVFVPAAQEKRESPVPVAAVLAALALALVLRRRRAL